ncbi:MAG: two-component sensor histidine kinase [Sulfurospirillum sp.]|nr:MAG: two-component sensor histidine kinase [Sulfurospirillum sp.]
MIDKELLNSLDLKDKEKIISTLDTLITQTYAVEDEYKALRASYDALQDTIEQIIESLPHAIWVIELSGEVFLQNSMAKQIVRILADIDRSKSSSEIEFMGKIYLVNITQNDSKMMISATDITEQKRAERLASMGQVAAHLAHEIRNPIGSISILSSTLLNKIPIQYKPIVLEMKKAIFRVERIIKSTLLFTKGVKISKEKIELSLLKDEIEEAYENYSFTKDIDLKINFSDDFIYGDLDTLSIVMQNFLYNAIDAIEEDHNESGVVEFSNHKDKQFDVIKVIDSGVAILDKNILYEPFKTTKTKGHGLGLSLSLEIIRAHGGKIDLLEDEKGFLIYLEHESN